MPTIASSPGLDASDHSFAAQAEWFCRNEVQVGLVAHRHVFAEEPFVRRRDRGSDRGRRGRLGEDRIDLLPGQADAGAPVGDVETFFGLDRFAGSEQRAFAPGIFAHQGGEKFHVVERRDLRIEAGQALRRALPGIGERLDALRERRVPMLLHARVALRTRPLDRLVGPLAQRIDRRHRGLGLAHRPVLQEVGKARHDRPARRHRLAHLGPPRLDGLRGSGRGRRLAVERRIGESPRSSVIRSIATRIASAAALTSAAASIAR